MQRLDNPARGVLILLSLAFFANCDPEPLVSRVPPVQPEPGLQVFPTAREFDGPGQVFRIDREGVWRRVVDLSGDLQITRAREQMPKVFYDRQARAGLVLSLLGFPVSGSATGRRRVEVTMAVANPEREFVQENDLRSAVQAALPTIRFVDRNQYYVIGETVLADSVEFRVARASVDSIGGTAQIDSIVQTTPGVSWRDTANTTLVMRLTPAKRVFYKAFLITPEGLNLGGAAADVATGMTLSPVRVTLDVVAAEGIERR